MPEPSKNCLVYVVDDEHIVASTLALILGQRGFDVTAFTEPLLALEAARSRTPDLLISDVVMPRLSGVELALAVRRDCPSCKIVLLSGQAATADLLASAGAAEHEFELLTKPIRPVDLLHRLQSILERVPS